MIYTIMLAACVAGCQPSHGAGETNVNSARQMFDAFNCHDWQAMASYYAEPASHFSIRISAQTM